MAWLGFLFLSAHQLAFSDRDDERIYPIIGQCSVQHGSKCLLVIDGVVSNQDAAGYHVGDDRFVTPGIDLLLRVEEAE